MIFAAIVSFGVFLVGPFFVGSGTTCSEGDNGGTDQRSVSKCEVEEVEKIMRKKKLPKELKVEVEGKLYSVPDNVEMVSPAASQRKEEKWWESLTYRARCSYVGSVDDDNDYVGNESTVEAATPPSPDKHPTSRAVDDDGIVTTPSDKDRGGMKGTAAASEKDVRAAGDHSCQICFDQDHSAVMLPCGHGGLCWECGLHIFALTEQCPMCRMKIQLLVPLNGKKRYEGVDQFVYSAVFGKDRKPLGSSIPSGSEAPSLLFSRERPAAAS